MAVQRLAIQVGAHCRERHTGQARDPRPFWPAPMASSLAATRSTSVARLSTGPGRLPAQDLVTRDVDHAEEIVGERPCRRSPRSAARPAPSRPARLGSLLAFATPRLRHAWSSRGIPPAQRLGATQSAASRSTILAQVPSDRRPRSPGTARRPPPSDPGSGPARPDRPFNTSPTPSTARPASAPATSRCRRIA